MQFSTIKIQKKTFSPSIQLSVLKKEKKAKKSSVALECKFKVPFEKVTFYRFNFQIFCRDDGPIAITKSAYSRDVLRSARQSLSRSRSASIERVEIGTPEEISVSEISACSKS